MISFKQIVRGYADSGALNKLVGFHEAVSDQVFMTKGGDLFVVVRLKGLDYEGLDAPLLDRASRNFENAQKSLGSHFRIYQYLLKRQMASFPFQTYPEMPVVDEAVSNRAEYLRAKEGALHSVEIYWVIQYERAREAAGTGRRLGELFSDPRAFIRHWFSAQERSAALVRNITHDQEILLNRTQTLLAQLGEALSPTLLEKQAAFAFLRSLLNYDSPGQTAVGCDDASLKYDTHLDYQACCSVLECHRDHLILGDAHVQVLTIKEPPSKTFAHMLPALQEIPSQYVITSEWKSVDNTRARHVLQMKRHHFHNIKVSVLPYLANSGSTGQAALVDDSATALVNELGHVLEEIEVSGTQFGEFSFTIVLYDHDPARLRRSVAACFKVFGACDAQLIEERYNLLNAFLAVLPGNALFNLRRMWMLSTNYADLSFLFGLGSGDVESPDLGGEYLAVFETNHGTPYYFNLHHDGVAHAFISGAPGSGKSFLVNFLLTHLQKYRPYTFIFDLGGSYKSLTHLMGGSYLKISGESSGIAINPFCLPPTGENLQFLLSFVRVLIESGGYTMTSEDERDLFDQIKNLYVIDAAQRRLSTLANVLKRSLRVALQNWVQGGPYGALFDHADDTLTFARFQTFDFEGFEKKPKILEPLLFYILHRANASIYSADLNTTFKAFVMDEAWRFLRHPTIRAYIVEALKTWRKRNAGLILATQSADDLLQSETLAVVVENCPTKLFLANPGLNRETYRSLFHLSETEADLVAALRPKGQVLLKRPDMARVLNLNLDRKGYWLYTNNPHDNERRRRAFEEHGFEEGLEILSRS